jgi:hypothetical protein
MSSRFSICECQTVSVRIVLKVRPVPLKRIKEEHVIFLTELLNSGVVPAQTRHPMDITRVIHPHSSNLITASPETHEATVLLAIPLSHGNLLTTCQAVTSSGSGAYLPT